MAPVEILRYKSGTGNRQKMPTEALNDGQGAGCLYTISMARMTTFLDRCGCQSFQFSPKPTRGLNFFSDHVSSEMKRRCQSMTFDFRSREGLY
jgi:hypothetical protein